MNGKISWLFFYITPFTVLPHKDIRRDYLLTHLILKKPDPHSILFYTIKSYD